MFSLTKFHKNILTTVYECEIDPVPEPTNIPHVITPLILVERFAGKKRLTFDLN